MRQTQRNKDLRAPWRRRYSRSSSARLLAYSRLQQVDHADMLVLLQAIHSPPVWFPSAWEQSGDRWTVVTLLNEALLRTALHPRRASFAATRLKPLLALTLCIVNIARYLVQRGHCHRETDLIASPP